MASSNGHTPEWPYEFALLPLNQLYVDKYQRPLTTFVEKIEREYDPALVGTLVVSRRSKTRYAVIDGQTRAEGMRRRKEKVAPCVVYEGLTVAQEASLFAKFVGERKGMASASKFIALLISEDPWTVAVNEVVVAAGFEVSHNVSTQTIGAVAALEYVYGGCSAAKKNRKADPELLARTLATIRATWPELPDGAKSGALIKGLGFFLKFTKNVDDDKLTERMGRLSPTELAKRGDSLREGRGMRGNSPAYLAEAIAAEYRRSKPARR